MLDIPTTMIDIGKAENQSWVIEMINNILIEVLTSLAEQERVNIRERQAQGLAQMPVNPKTGKKRSLKTGRDIGRPPAVYPKQCSMKQGCVYFIIPWHIFVQVHIDYYCSYKFFTIFNIDHIY